MFTTNVLSSEGYAALASRYHYSIVRGFNQLHIAHVNCRQHSTRLTGLDKTRCTGDGTAYDLAYADG